MKVSQIGLESGIMTFVNLTGTKGDGHDLFYQVILYKTTLFNDSGF